jgi:hypothetical protein
MDRRKALAALGLSAAGGFTAAAQGGHGKKDNGAAGPLGQLHGYLCAYHLAKKDPTFVVEAHHYCAGLSDDVHQCVIFDKNGKNARILGVEYIISDKLYRSLTVAEKKYYHPHTYEITSGLLIAPGLSPEDEDKLMTGLLTTSGKTWHTWPDPATALPMGEPLLMWSTTKDGQVKQELLDQRDKQFKVSTAKLRKRRAVLGPVPQIEPPKSLDEVGRQWTKDGPDQPARD